jgi:hypothetical protein
MGTARATGLDLYGDPVLARGACDVGAARVDAVAARVARPSAGYDAFQCSAVPSDFRTGCTSEGPILSCPIASHDRWRFCRTLEPCGGPGHIHAGARETGEHQVEYRGA